MIRVIGLEKGTQVQIPISLQSFPTFRDMGELLDLISFPFSALVIGTNLPELLWRWPELI